MCELDPDKVYEVWERGTLQRWVDKYDDLLKQMSHLMLFIHDQRMDMEEMHRDQRRKDVDGRV